MAKRSVQLNNLENKIKIINENILNLKNIYEKNSFDVVVSDFDYVDDLGNLIGKWKKEIFHRRS